MDIEQKLKEAHPDWTDAMITARRVEGFKNIFKSQRPYFNWRDNLYKPSHDSLLKVSKEFDLTLENLMQ